MKLAMEHATVDGFFSSRIGILIHLYLQFWTFASPELMLYQVHSHILVQRYRTVYCVGPLTGHHLNI